MGVWVCVVCHHPTRMLFVTFVRTRFSPFYPDQVSPRLWVDPFQTSKKIILSKDDLLTLSRVLKTGDGTSRTKTIQ